MGNNSSNIFPQRQCKYTEYGLTENTRAVLFFIFLSLIICQVALVLYLENKMAEVQTQEKQIQMQHY